MEQIARISNGNNGIVQPGTSAVPLVALVPLPSLATKDQATPFATNHSAYILPEGSDVTQDDVLNHLGLGKKTQRWFDRGSRTIQSGIVISAARLCTLKCEAPFPKAQSSGTCQAHIRRLNQYAPGVESDRVGGPIQEKAYLLRIWGGITV